MAMPQKVSSQLFSQRVGRVTADSLTITGSFSFPASCFPSEWEVQMSSYRGELQYSFQSVVFPASGKLFTGSKPGIVTCFQSVVFPASGKRSFKSLRWWVFLVSIQLFSQRVGRLYTLQGHVRDNGPFPVSCFPSEWEAFASYFSALEAVRFPFSCFPSEWEGGY